MNHTVITAAFLAALVVFSSMLAIALIASNEARSSDFWAKVYPKTYAKWYVATLVIVSLVPAALNYDNVPVRMIAELCWNLMDANWVFTGATLLAVLLADFLVCCVFAIGCIVAFSMDTYASVKRSFRSQQSISVRG